MPLVPNNDDMNRAEITATAFAINTDFQVVATGYRATATAGTTTNLDFTIGAEDRYIQGLRLRLVNHAEADTINLKIVDKDGIYAPAGTVLKQFGFNWNLDHTVCDQGHEGFNYLARIYAGLYLRMAYVSTGLLDVTIKLNAYLHKKIT